MTTAIFGKGCWLPEHPWWLILFETPCLVKTITVVQLHSVYVLSTPWTWISTQQVYVLLFLSTPSTYTVFNLDWIKYLPLYEGRFFNEPGLPGNTGGPWVATFAAVPNLDGTFAILYLFLLSFSVSDFCFCLLCFNHLYNDKFQDMRRTANKRWNGFPLYIEGLHAIMRINPSIYCGKPF